MKKKPADKKNAVIPQETVEDMDDLVHSNLEEKPTELGEEDPDDLVHRPIKQQPNINENSLEDPDDLVHDYDEEEDE